MYTVTDLAPTAVTGISDAWAINASGMVAGQMDTAVGFAWTPNTPNDVNGTLQQLPTLMPPAAGLPSECAAFGINTAGDILGSCETVDAGGTTVTRAFLFRAGAMSDLGTFVPDPSNPGFFLGNSEARGINDAGQIVGKADDTNGVEHGFFLDLSVSPTMRNLFSLVPPIMLPGPADPSVANAINNSGMVVGTASAADAASNIVERAFSWDPATATMTDLGTLVPDPANPGKFLGESSAEAVNNAGQIFGDSETVPPGVGSIRMATGFGATPVLMAGPSPGSGTGINDNPAGAEMVGWFQSGVGASGPVTSGLYVSNAAGVVDLNSQLATPNWTIQKATGINDKGQICGIGTHATLGANRAILLTPTP
jgi:probable HAF family extracellular repeat protein